MEMTSYNVIIYFNFKYANDNYPLIITPGGYMSSKSYEEKERKKVYTEKLNLEDDESVMKFLKIHILSGFSDGYKPSFPDVIQITNYCFLITSNGFLRVKFNNNIVSGYLYPYRIL